MKDIHIIENILSEEKLAEIQQACRLADFGEIDVGCGDVFYMNFPSISLNDILYGALEDHYNTPIEPIVALLRLNTACLDDTLRIHSDRDILGDTPSHAAVFHITDNPEVENGTAFWKHKTHGEYLPAGVNQDESEYGDISLWEFQDLALYRRYAQDSREMIEEGLIMGSVITTLETTGESGERLVSRDFNKIESHYLMGG